MLTSALGSMPEVRVSVFQLLLVSAAATKRLVCDCPPADTVSVALDSSLLNCSFSEATTMGS